MPETPVLEIASVVCANAPDGDTTKTEIETGDVPMETVSALAVIRVGILPVKPTNMEDDGSKHAPDTDIEFVVVGTLTV